MLFDENFTFDTSTTPRSPSLSSDTTLLSTSTRDTSRAVSPCTTSAYYPPPRFSVTDLAASFASSRLRQDSQICYDSCEAYANLEDDEEGWEIPTLSRTRTQPQRAYSPGRRMARQLNTRLLCSSSHAKDIAALVEQMVESGEHCNVNEKRCEQNDDEGYDSGSNGATSRRSSLAVQRSRMDYRRTSDMKLTGGARVTKAVRQKKDVKCRRVRSGENEHH